MIPAKRYDWADFMKGIMMFLVILYHSEVYYGTGHTWSWIFEPFFLSGFFFISGYLFTKDITSVNFQSKIKQVLRAIIIPYFIFAFALSLPKVLVGHSSIEQLFIDIIVLRSSWFVIAIAVMQLLFSSVLSIKPTVINLLGSTLIMFLLGYAFVLMYRDCPLWLTDNPWLQSKELPNRLPACINLALVQSPYFAAGILFRHFENKIPRYLTHSDKSLIISILTYILIYLWIDHQYIGSSMCIAMNQYNNILLIFFIGYIGIWALMCISNKIKRIKAINYIGKHSVIFYFLNGGALTFVSFIVKRITILNPDSYINQIIVAIIATALMFPCVWFITRYLPILVGNKDSFNRISNKLGLKIQW